jgi:hypothetical protein
MKKIQCQRHYDFCRFHSATVPRNSATSQLHLRREIWYARKRNIALLVPHHSGLLPMGTLRAIIGQTGLSMDEFLK